MSRCYLGRVLGMPIWIALALDSVCVAQDEFSMDLIVV